MKLVPLPLLLGFVLSSLFFYLVPAVDLWVSGLFYDPARGGFYLAELPWVQFVFQGIPVFTVLMVITLLALWAWTRWRRPTALGLNAKAYAYLLVVLVIGPGLLNSLSKDNWHRARPISVEQFGGERKFTPAFVIADQCDVNCSFFSGHPTSLYFFTAVALVAPRAWRRRWLGVAIGGGLTVGLGRIIQGGHFFSDVIVSGFMVAISAYLVYWWMYVRGRPATTSPR